MSPIRAVEGIFMLRLCLWIFVTVFTVQVAAAEPPKRRYPPGWYYRIHLLAAKNLEGFSPNSIDARNLGNVETSKLSRQIQKQSEDALQNPNRLALMLIQDGVVLYRGFNNGADSGSTLLSHSVAKSLTSLAVGEALCQGKINSLQDRVDKYLPALANNNYGSARIVDLLHMASGIEGDIQYDQLYPSEGREIWNQQKTIIDIAKEYGSKETKYFDESKRGTFYNYVGMHTYLLGAAVRAATGMTFAQWFGQSVGKSAGVANEFYWIRDSNNDAMTAGHFSGTLDDYARISLYVLDGLDGKKGECIQSYLKSAVNDKITKGNMLERKYGHLSYGYQFRTDLVDGPSGSFKMQGFGGQHIFFDPEKKRVLLGFSQDWDDKVQDLFKSWSNER
jgi:CubicO group peptidase (beta-lactamase class C family)